MNRRQALSLMAKGAIGIAAGALLPGTARAGISELKRNVHNPFVQPNNTTRYYGSGDVDGDGKELNGTDYDLMRKMANSQTASNDFADIDGDGKVTNSDLTLLYNFMTGNIPYLPGHWNKLQTREERESWVKKMFAIDKTNEILPKSDWDCSEFSIQVCMNFSGLENLNNIPSKYKRNYIARFNLPVYSVTRYPVIAHGEGHGYNAILVGDNSLNANDWFFVDDSHLEDLYVEVGKGNGFQSMPYNSEFCIYSLDSFIDEAYVNGIRIAKFKYNYDIPELVEQDDSQLVLTRPTPTSVSEQIPSKFALKQNYPNPFNSSTTIEYKLEKPERVSIEIYNSAGQKLETLVNDNMPAGAHAVRWNANKYSSGTYIYKLRSGNQMQTKKIMLVK